MQIKISLIGAKQRKKLRRAAERVRVPTQGEALRFANRHY
jgi:hypothetical protein